jgi:hypothetical protein
MSASAQGGDDTLTGGDNSGAYESNHLFGDAASMSDFAQGGNDTLTGGDNSGSGGGVVYNFLYGDAQTMSGSAQGGDDRLISGINATDQMWGDAEFLLDSATGGNDTFVFAGAFGQDLVNDFHQGEDIIKFSGFYKIPADAVEHLPADIPPRRSVAFCCHFSDLTIEIVDTNSDNVLDSVIHFDASNSVTVLGVTGLTDADFQFVV